MFEKEAEEGLNKRIGTIGYNCRQNCQKPYTDGFQDGATFGYNKAKEDADEMKSRFLELCNLKDMRIKELEKANEYAKTIVQDLLDNSDEYARQRAMDFLEEVENEAD